MDIYSLSHQVLWLKYCSCTNFYVFISSLHYFSKVLQECSSAWSLKFWIHLLPSGTLPFPKSLCFILDLILATITTFANCKLLKPLSLLKSSEALQPYRTKLSQIIKAGPGLALAKCHGPYSRWTLCPVAALIWYSSHMSPVTWHTYVSSGEFFYLKHHYSSVCLPDCCYP